MRIITYVEALREALREEMQRDPRVFIMGEDVGQYGGIFKVTDGLVGEFGEERVRDTPISEPAIVGSALGAALTGMRPVAEIMFNDFIMVAADQLFNQMAKMRYMFGGKARVPAVVRTNVGAGRAGAAQHSQSLQAWAMHIPGIKVATPSNPYDAKGLLKTAIRDDNPVLFLEHKLLYTMKGEVPKGDYTIPFGEAAIVTRGDDVSVVAVSSAVNKAKAVAGRLSKEGIGVEVIDVRTLVPYDRETVGDSVKKTGRLVISDEGCETAGVAAEIAFKAMEDAFYCLKSPVRRVCAPDVPVPFSPTLERLVVPDEDRIEQAIRATLED